MEKGFCEILYKMEEEIKTTEKITDQEKGSISLPQLERLPSPAFVKVEKNLASLGFFTPSSKRLRNAQEKSFTITTIVDGKRLELKGTIIPSAKYGLPITADQDKWIALCKILTDILQREGKVSNPISFTSAEILRLLHKHRHSGKNYREVEEWLDVLFSTTIFSEGVVYLANEKRRVKDRFRVFERAVSLGKELPDGRMADKNYIWFSDWQLQNINSNHLLPIDIETYRQLKNHITKALVPLLQVWLYATREEGVFEKRYDELCQFLNIRQYRFLSLITRTLGPSLGELQEFGYLADWQIEKTSDGHNYKIIFFHGEKFHRDRRARLSRQRTPNEPEHFPGGSRSTSESSSRAERQLPAPRHQHSKPEPAPLRPTNDPQLLAEFTRRGITEKKASELLANLKPGQDVVAQLELGEQLAKNSRVPIVNPPGFYIRLIESNTSVPDGFETSAKRKAREENERKERERAAAEEARQDLEWDYDQYCQRETDRYIQENPALYQVVTEAKWKENRDRYQSLSPELITRMAASDAQREVRKQVSLLTLAEFAKRRKEGTDFSLKPVGLSPDSDILSQPSVPEDVTGSDRPAGTATDHPVAPERGEAIQSVLEATTPEPAIQLVVESAPPETGGNAAAPGLV